MSNINPIDSAEATAPGHVQGKKEMKNSTALQYWTIDDVTQWLERAGFDVDVRKKFAAHRVAGKHLSRLTIDVLVRQIELAGWAVASDVMEALKDLQKATLASSDSAGSGISDVPSNDIPASHPYIELWQCTWKSMTYKPFKKFHVERDSSPRIHVPSFCWVLETHNWMKEFDPESSISGVLARDEYREALRAVVDFCQRKRLHFPTEVDGEDEMAMETDNLDQPFANPFLDLPEDFVSREKGFILIGHPGIGKTIWLFIILILRLKAGLPTILQSARNRLFYFDSHGVEQLKYSSATSPFELSSRFSPSTWCLIDTNTDLMTIPPLVLNLGLFVVQASSPRDERFQWYKKQNSAVLFYFLKPWSLSELIAGRTVQKEVHSEEDLESFFNKFGPSARSAYTDASRQDQHEASLRRELGGITREVLHNIVIQCTSLKLTDTLSHRLIVIEPSTVRYDSKVTIPTRYIYELLRNTLHNHILEGASILFDIFNRNQACRGTAGYMLEDALHYKVPTGGQWEVTRLKANPPGSKNTHWKAPHPITKPQYLRIGYQGIISIDDEPLPTGASFDAFPVYSYLPEALELKKAYYWPYSSSEPTLDSFIYDPATNTATIFQSSVSSSHTVSPKVFQWLQRTLDIQNFQYVYVTTSASEVIDLIFPNDLKCNIRDIFSLVITKYPV